MLSNNKYGTFPYPQYDIGGKKVPGICRSYVLADFTRVDSFNLQKHGEIKQHN